MKLRSFLHRRHINEVPLLPTIEPDDSSPLRNAFTLRSTRARREERLERLLTPFELDILTHHRV
ncbi:hypothetical protein ACWEVD_11940 [Nocardia thailandica]|uniref:hypothetical protein n=1 Tax=Nocardia thailandica TaxID=257275 RepID=UPI0002E22AAC|nr:hypothetical protein [Nocardia thailandica]